MWALYNLFIYVVKGQAGFDFNPIPKLISFPALISNCHFNFAWALGFWLGQVWSRVCLNLSILIINLY